MKYLEGVKVGGEVTKLPFVCPYHPTGRIIHTCDSDTVEFSQKGGDDEV